MPGNAALAASMPERLCGWCSGASGMSSASRRMICVVDQDRRGEVDPAMHDAMADGGDADVAETGCG